MARTITWDELKELNQWARDVTGSHDDEWGFAECLYPVLDRLQLRAEGEPDCADLADQVAAINAACDDAGIAKLEGEPAKRVKVMAEMLADAHAARESYRSDWHDAIDRANKLLADLASVRADLEAERAQLASKATPDSDKLLCDFTRLLIRDGNAATEFLALASLAKRIRAALKEGDA